MVKSNLAVALTLAMDPAVHAILGDMRKALLECQAIYSRKRKTLEEIMLSSKMHKAVACHTLKLTFVIHRGASAAGT